MLKTLNHILIPAVVAAATLGPISAQPGQGSGTARTPSENIAELRWTTDTRTEGNVEVTTTTYQSLMAQGPRTLVIQEERRIQVDPDTVRVTRTTYNLDSRGRRRPVERVEEEQRRTGEQSDEINRTIATPDSHGRFEVIRQEVVSSVRTDRGADTTTTVFAPDVNGGMEAVQVIDERETLRPSGEVEVRTTASVQRQARWVPNEQRLKVTRPDEEGRPVREWEQVFRPNASGKLALAEETDSRYSRSADGSAEWTVETRTAPRGDGRLELSRRVVSQVRPLADGGEEMVQEVLARKPGAPSEGLELMERTTTSTRPAGEGETEVTLEIQARSANGGLRLVSRSSAVVPGSKEETKPAEGEQPPPSGTTPPR